MRKHMGAIALALALAFGVQGCYGKFALTRKLWKFNGSIGNKFVNELVFLVFNIIPVYGIAGFVDAVIVNTIEFWSGSNPAMSKVVTDGDRKMAMSFDQASGLVQLSYYEKGELKSVSYLRKTDSAIELLGADKQVQKVAALNTYGEAYMADAKGLVLAQSVVE